MDRILTHTTTNREPRVQQSLRNPCTAVYGTLQEAMRLTTL